MTTCVSSLLCRLMDASNSWKVVEFQTSFFSNSNTRYEYDVLQKKMNSIVRSKGSTRSNQVSGNNLVKTHLPIKNERFGDVRVPFHTHTHTHKKDNTNAKGRRQRKRWGWPEIVGFLMWRKWLNINYPLEAQDPVSISYLSFRKYATIPPFTIVTSTLPLCCVQNQKKDKV